MDTLYIFNPEHDLALANGSAYFCPPISAQRFATEAAALLIWIAENNDSVLCPPVNAEFEQYLRLFQKTSKLETHHSCALSHFDRIMPWGWDFKLVQILKQYQWAQDLYFSDSQLEIIKKLSHRQTACRTLDFLQTLYGNLIPLPHTSLITDQIDDIELFFKKEKDLIFKMPWSGSGKGLRWGRHTLTDKDKGWITNCIKQQGCVVVEKRYPVIQDFAMEFEIDESVHFQGYSLFNTRNGAYSSNVLINDKMIETVLSQWINLTDLENIKQSLILFFNQTFLGNYKGPFGVDMFIYAENGNFKIHPAVEINLRLTMGRVAHEFVLNYLPENATASLQIEYSPIKGDLRSRHQADLIKNPPFIKNQKLQSGYLTLIPIEEDSHYRIFVKNTSSLN